MTFTVAWIASLLVLIATYGLVGWLTQQSFTGLLVDNRGRISLNNFQLSLWSVLVLSTLLAAFFTSGLDPVALEVPEQLLVLMGISVGSATASVAVKSVKDMPKDNKVGRKGVKPAEGEKIEPKVSQVYLEEEGDRADQVVSISKFQNFVLTLVVAFAYIVLTLRTQDYPPLPDQVLWLIGISHAGYLAGKIPNVR